MPGPEFPNISRVGHSGNLSAPYQRHLRGHQRHELDIGVERQARDEHDGIGNVFQIHAGSTIRVPLACMTPLVMRSVISVAALPISIWLHAMSYFRPSRE